ncbi:response regulator [Spirosoma sp. KUDC1026]|uniref:response regulator n=1 Tax=Spirosoma sp. KUDC1026 TaxID=2745947 RepID=UPI00159B852B|nr:response regulator [Spirosoma sp. KUDC1026]QKZ13370.1 response regulator [Spirosoma sp. KUDC1026]
MTADERMQILIVEDEAILAMELSDSLEQEGYHVVGRAANGRRALEIFLQQRVDLVLCDITIKGDWDGIETVRQLMNERPVAVVYLTALTDRETLDRAKQTYPSAFLNKPYQLNSLRTAIELAIHNFSQRQTALSADISQPAVERDNAAHESILRMGNSLFIKQNYQFVRTSLDEILYLEAENVYTTLVTASRKYVLRLSLGGALDLIRQSQLIRIHRSYAVNIQQVVSFSETEIIVGSYTLPLGRSYKDAFLQQLRSR